MNKIEICFSPALYPAYHNPEAVVVVVDIFRATTTMVTAFSNGVSSIRPVASVEEAEAYKRQGWLVGAERNVKRCAFADFGNSPFDYPAEKVAGRALLCGSEAGCCRFVLRLERQSERGRYGVRWSVGRLSDTRIELWDSFRCCPDSFGYVDFPSSFATCLLDGNRSLCAFGEKPVAGFGVLLFVARFGFSGARFVGRIGILCATPGL